MQRPLLPPHQIHSPSLLQLFLHPSSGRCLRQGGSESASDSASRCDSWRRPPVCPTCRPRRNPICQVRTAPWRVEEHVQSLVVRFVRSMIHSALAAFSVSVRPEALLLSAEVLRLLVVGEWRGGAMVEPAHVACSLLSALTFLTTCLARSACIVLCALIGRVCQARRADGDGRYYPAERPRKTFRRAFARLLLSSNRARTAIPSSALARCSRRSQA